MMIVATAALRLLGLLRLWLWMGLMLRLRRFAMRLLHLRRRLAHLLMHRLTLRRGMIFRWPLGLLLRHGHRRRCVRLLDVNRAIRLWLRLRRVLSHGCLRLPRRVLGEACLRRLGLRLSRRVLSEPRLRLHRHLGRAAIDLRRMRRRRLGLGLLWRLRVRRVHERMSWCGIAV